MTDNFFLEAGHKCRCRNLKCHRVGKLQLGPAAAEQLLEGSAEMIVDFLKPGNKQGTHILRQIPNQLKSSSGISPRLPPAPA